MQGKLTPQDIERFWSKADRSGGPDACWPWQGTRARRGYGRFKIRTGEALKAHRVAYYIANGEEPQLWVLHSCDNPPCVNPRHLSQGTHAENMRQRTQRNRTAEGSRSASAKLTEGDIPEIRRRLAAGHTLVSIARSYHVGETTIRDIRERHTWDHVPD